MKNIYILVSVFLIQNTHAWAVHNESGQEGLDPTADKEETSTKNPTAVEKKASVKESSDTKDTDKTQQTMDEGGASPKTETIAERSKSDSDKTKEESSKPLGRVNIPAEAAIKVKVDDFGGFTPSTEVEPDKVEKVDPHRELTATQLGNIDSGARASVSPNADGSFQFKVNGNTEKVTKLSPSATQEEALRAKHVDPNSPVTFSQAMGGEGVENVEGYEFNPPKKLKSFFGVKTLTYYFPTNRSTQQQMLGDGDADISKMIVKRNADGTVTLWAGGAGMDNTPPK